MRDRISVSEIYGPVVQGEGAVIGRPTVFVRTGGCDYRCDWCDSLYAVLPRYRDTWVRMGTEEVFAEVRRLSEKPILVTLSGGNPALQPLGGLIERGREEGYTFAVETQGSVAKDWFGGLDHLTLSPKPPSSGMETDWGKLGRCLEAAGERTSKIFKVVVFDDGDYAYAREVAIRFPEVPMYLQVGNDYPPGAAPHEVPEPDMSWLLDRYSWLAEKVIADGWNEVRVLPQLHVLVWEQARRVDIGKPRHGNPDLR